MMDTKGKLESFFATFAPLKYGRNATLIKPQDFISHIFYLESGYVRQYILSREGEEITIHIFRPTSFFPMMLALSGTINKYYFEAMTSVSLYKAPRDKVIEFIKNNPDVNLELSRRLSQGIAGLLVRIENLIFDDVEKKLASLLFYLGEHFGEERAGKVVIKLRLTHKDIATWVGTSRESVSRQMKQFENDKLLSYKNSEIVLRDISKIKEIASLSKFQL